MSSTPNAISSLSGLFSSGPSNTNTGGVQNTLMPVGVGGNQYSMYPNTPGTAIPSSGVGTTLPGATSPYSTNTGSYYATGGDVPGTNSEHLTPTLDPTLTQQYYNMLSGQIGQGLPAFDLSAILPSSGATTAPGTLTAPLNSTLQQLQAFLSGTPSNTPGSSQLQQLATTGDPINQTPAWQAMIASEQQNTAENANNLREQFAGTGSLSSSPFATAMQQFYNQNTENQNAQLTQASTAAQQQAVQNMLTADTGIQNEAQQFGTGMQNLDQSAIQNLLTQYNLDLPQNNPLLANESQAANMFPPVAGQTPTTMQNISGLISSIGSLF